MILQALKQMISSHHRFPENFDSWTPDARSAYLELLERALTAEKTVEDMQHDNDMLRSTNLMPDSSTDEDTSDTPAIQKAINITRNSQAILQRTCQIAVQHLDATSAYINTWNESKNTSTVIAGYIALTPSHEHIDDLGVTYNCTDSFKNAFLAPTRYFVLHDYNDLQPDDRREFNEYGIKTILYIPLRLKARMIGYLEIWDTRKNREFSEDSIEYVIELSHEIIDIVHTSQLHYSLIQSQEFYHHILDTMREAVVQVNTQGIIEYANHTFQKMVYADYEDILGKPLQQIHDIPEDSEGELALKKPDGETRWLQISSAPMFSDSGRVSGIVYVYTDISQLKYIEQELIMSKERYRHILEAVSDYSYSMNVTPDNQITLNWLGGDPLAILGYTSDDFKSGSVFDFALDLTYPEYRKIMEESFAELLQNRRTSVVVKCLRKDGKDAWLDIVRQPIWDEKEQRVIRYYGAVRDVTAQKEAEQALLEQAKLKFALEKEQEFHVLRNRYLSTIAHDLRTPLASISLSNQILVAYGQKISDDKRDESLMKINSAVNYLNNMLGELSMVARSERGYLEYSPQLVNPQQICLSTINDFIPIAKGNHKIKFEGIGDLSNCCLDENMFNHILLNLLTNAIKYSPDESEVYITLTGQADNLVLKIKDEGIGIPEQDLPRLFEPFHRARNVGKIKGTGLGLSIVKELVEQHDGTITVESVVGKGTTFIITIPRKQDCPESVW